MAAVLGDIDGLVFAGGIGENDVATRAEVMEGGSRLGMRADKARNLEPTGRISAADSRVEAWVVPTDKERMIARHTGALLGWFRWSVDAVPKCPISGRYRTFASSQSPGNADRFPLPHSIRQRSVNPGSIALAFAGGALSDTERSSRNQVDPGFQAWCDGGHSAHWPGDEPRKVGLLPAALLAMHRVEAPARPGLAFRSATPRDREVMTGGTGTFLSPPCARGGRGDKNPLHPRQADLLSEPGGKPGAEAVGHDRLQACSDPAVLASVLRCGSIPASVGAVDGRRERAAWPFSGSCNVFDKARCENISHLVRFRPAGSP